MYRQGDILIVPVSEKDRWVHDRAGTWALVNGGIVERGEATGHAHRLVLGDVMQQVRNQRELRLVSSGGAQLTHDEHDTIVLPEGEYRVLRQREFQADDRAWQYVSD